jgi:pimeloyl-ACP methyl ester carboxylesterase
MVLFFAIGFCAFWGVTALMKWPNLLPILALLATVFVVSVVASLVLLRTIVYFRDNYRANNFAVPDLVELIRRLDTALQEKNLPEKVNLSFVAHSMGGFVATNAIRILSDVFDSGTASKKRSAIGHSFCLKRLLLVAPDIPTLTIQSNRANFLASSLRRFDEAYLFSSEGDLALRLASTVANYFSFPARTRKSGYRLGNVTIAPDQTSSAHSRYGIVNLETLKNHSSAIKSGHFQGLKTALHSLFVSNLSDGRSDSLADLSARNAPNSQHLTIADLVTYFDCTDYLEAVRSDDAPIIKFFEENEKYIKFVRNFKILESNSKIKALGILTRAKGIGKEKKILNVLDYTLLLNDFIRGRDVHGGYFAAPFSQKLIYHLAFMGFHDLLLPYSSDPTDAIAKFNRECDQYWLQILLSPLHYSSAYVQGDELEAIKENLISIIRQS